MFHFRLHFYVIPALMAVMFLIAVFASLPPREVRIEAGPVGGFFHATALHLQTELKAFGIRTQIINVDDTTRIIERLNEPGPRKSSAQADVGFVAQNLRAREYPNVRSLGSIMIEPLFIFVRSDSGIRNVTELAGQRLAIGPPQSGTRLISASILQHFGISEENATFVPEHATAAEELIANGKVDAAFFLLPPETELIQRLGQNPDYRLLPLEHALALSKLQPHLQHVTIPKGGFSIGNRLPAEDIPAVALPVAIVARKDFNASLTALIACLLQERFARATLVSEADTLPKGLYPELEMNPHAEELYLHGLPYLLQSLPLDKAVLLWTSISSMSFVLIVLFCLSVVLNYASLYLLLLELRERYLENVHTFQREARKALQDGVIDEAEAEDLQELRTQLDLSARTARSIVAAEEGTGSWTSRLGRWRRRVFNRDSDR